METMGFSKKNHEHETIITSSAGKTINEIIENSALGAMNTTYRYAVLFLFSSILVTAFSLLILVLNNMEYVSAQFNF